MLAVGACSYDFDQFKYDPEVDGGTEVAADGSLESDGGLTAADTSIPAADAPFVADASGGSGDDAGEANDGDSGDDSGGGERRRLPKRLHDEGEELLWDMRPDPHDVHRAMPERQPGEELRPPALPDPKRPSARKRMREHVRHMHDGRGLQHDPSGCKAATQCNAPSAKPDLAAREPSLPARVVPVVGDGHLRSEAPHRAHRHPARSKLRRHRSPRAPDSA